MVIDEATPPNDPAPGEPGPEPPQRPDFLPAGTRSEEARRKAWWVWDPDGGLNV